MIVESSIPNLNERLISPPLNPMYANNKVCYYICCTLFDLLQYRPEKYSQKLNWLPPTTTRLVYCSPDEESDSDRERERVLLSLIHDSDFVMSDSDQLANSIDVC